VWGERGRVEVLSGMNRVWGKYEKMEMRGGERRGWGKIPLVTT